MPMLSDCNKYLILACWCCLLSWIAGPAAAGTESKEPEHWLAIETRHMLVLYRTPEDLARFDRQLKYGPSSRGLKSLFSQKSADNLEERVTGKVDALFERVQEILEMRRKMKKPTIFVHSNRQELHAAYRELFNRPCKIRAWYQHSTKSVYLNVRDLHEGMLAHELAHAIIDHYLLVRPPEATAEILARYVDSHLKE